MSAPTLTKPSSSELPVAGIIPFSATDWPGKLTVSVFTQGCPLRCVYCHNPSLQEFRPGAHSFAEALSLADARRRLIDGIVISGGEPTSCAGVATAIADAHAAGFPVGLHTCGYAPARIRELLTDPASTPDWVGLDIKALPSDMAEVIQRPAAVGNRVWESLTVLHDAGVDLQLRTTLWEGGVVDRHREELIAMVREKGFELVIQHARDSEGRPWREGAAVG